MSDDSKQEQIETIEETVEETKLPTPEELLSDMNDKYLRLFAEFDNYKKRVQKEKDELRMQVKTNILSSLLDIDSDIAIAVKNDKDNPGLKLIMSKLENYLKSQGIESIQTDSYDPDLHEVISVLETGEKKIIDVVSKGYKLGGKPFRFPKIILSR